MHKKRAAKNRRRRPQGGGAPHTPTSAFGHAAATSVLLPPASLFKRRLNRALDRHWLDRRRSLLACAVDDCEDGDEPDDYQLGGPGPAPGAARPLLAEEGLFLLYFLDWLGGAQGGDLEGEAGGTDAGRRGDVLPPLIVALEGS